MSFDIKPPQKKKPVAKKPASKVAAAKKPAPKAKKVAKKPAAKKPATKKSKPAAKPRPQKATAGGSFWSVVLILIMLVIVGGVVYTVWNNKTGFWNTIDKNPEPRGGIVTTFSDGIPDVTPEEEEEVDNRPAVVILEEQYNELYTELADESYELPELSNEYWETIDDYLNEF